MDKKVKIYNNINKNLEFIKKLYSIPESVDAILREFTVNIDNKNIKAFLIYYEGTTDSKQIDEFILEALHIVPRHKGTLEEIIEQQLISANQLAKAYDFETCVSLINYGGCGVFIDGLNLCFVADVKFWAGRNVSKPITENVLRGPNEGFCESLRTNTGLIRRLIKNENLINKNIIIGKKSNTSCNLLYIKDIANENIVKEAIRRMNSIDIDFLQDSGQLEQLLEDFTFFPTAQILSTEKSDNVASALSQGKVAILVDGSPFALILPVTFFDQTRSPEDNYLRFPYANLIRFIRVFAMLVCLFLPGLFTAMMMYHRESVPSYLLFTIASTREKVPLSVFSELIILEISFEFLREASLRIPNTIGYTIGITGGLILGQSAVEANLVSPIVTIIVAITAIGNFTIPNYSLSFAFRILKYLYIILGAAAGFFGIAFGIFLHLLVACGSQSFGVPYLAPLAPRYKTGEGKFFEKPIYKKGNREEYLNPKEKFSRSKICRSWAIGDNATHCPNEDYIDIYY